MKSKLLNTALSLCFPLIDLTLIATAILLSYRIYRLLGIGQSVNYQMSELISFIFLASSVTVLCMTGFQVYKKQSSVLNVEEIKNCIKSIVFSFFILLVILVFGKINLSRYTLALSFVITLTAVIIEKMIFYNFLPELKKINQYNRKILIYGAGELGKTLFRSIANSPKLRLEPVGFIDDDPQKKNMACYQSGFNSHNCVKVLGSRADIESLKAIYAIDEIYIAISDINHSYLISLLKDFKKIGLEASFVPNLHEAFLHKVKITIIGGVPTVKEVEDYLDSNYIIVKKILDKILACILCLMLFPLFVIVGILIKIDSKGPVIFKQDRVGKDGKIFRIFKFRSMYVDTNPNAVNPLTHDDPRITRVGSILRKLSIDEIPQIFNVIKGDMSFVGPRPEMPFIVAKYDQIHMERLKALPGITGLWQLSGDRKKPIHENMDYDLYYIRNISFFLDVTILIQSSIFAFKGI